MRVFHGPSYERAHIAVCPLLGVHVRSAGGRCRVSLHTMPAPRLPSLGA